MFYKQNIEIKFAQLQYCVIVWVLKQLTRSENIMSDEVNWNNPVTFQASKEGFEVKAIKFNDGYKISSPHLGFCVDKYGKPFNRGLGKEYHVKNE
jgi:hypothetical protein